MTRKYLLRFIVIHEGDSQDEGHYYGCLHNFDTLKWYKLDDVDVEEINE